MAGAVRFAAECESDPGQLFWAKATLGDLEVLLGTPESVTIAYREALVHAEKDWFALNSTRSQLCLLKDLGFLPETVDAGIAVFDRALRKLAKPEERWQPRQVFLFSGHMIDAPDRPTPRFPNDKADLAGRKIAEALDALGAGEGDLALTQGAPGGDILFAEACLKKGVRVLLLQPFREPEFIQKSILPSAEGDQWRARYFALKAQLKDRPRSMPVELGPSPRASTPTSAATLAALHGPRPEHR